MGAMMWWNVQTRGGRSILVKARYKAAAIDEAMERVCGAPEEIDEASVVAVGRFHRDAERRTLDGKSLSGAYR